MARNQLLQTAVDLLTGKGAGDISVDEGRHLKLRYAIGGQRRTLVLPRSPSDWRTEYNLIRDLKRQLREALEQTDQVSEQHPKHDLQRERFEGRQHHRK